MFFGKICDIIRANPTFAQTRIRNYENYRGLIMLKELKQRVFEQNLSLYKQGLVMLTWGNVSAIDRENGLMAIKPVGVPYDKLTEADIVIVDMVTKRPVDKKQRPSVDTPTHIYLYENFPEIGGIVHSYSTSAVAWAQAGLSIPAFGIMQADTFSGEIPCTRALTKPEITGDYERNVGKVIVETFKNFDPKKTPAVLVQNHGPFVWGVTPEQAVDNAAALEEVAKAAILTRQLNPVATPADESLLKKRHSSQHGKNSAYGRK